MATIKEAEVVGVKTCCGDGDAEMPGLLDSSSTTEEQLPPSLTLKKIKTLTDMHLLSSPSVAEFAERRMLLSMTAMPSDERPFVGQMSS